MDALALLCTLHADGPATLKRLRQAGCSTVEQIESFEPTRLGELIGVAPAAARRFLREAKSLRERVGAGWLEREDAGGTARVPSAFEPRGCAAPASSAAPSERTNPVSRTSPPVHTHDLSRPADTLRTSAVEQPARDAETVSADDATVRSAPSLSLGEARIVDRVLSVWRERDREDSRSVRAEDNEPAPTTAPVISTAPAARAAREHSVAPAARLAPGDVDGLDEEICERLAELGVDSLAALARADTLLLAGALGTGYTRLARLQFLSTRAALRNATAPEPKTAREKLSPAEVSLELPSPGIGIDLDVLQPMRAPAARPRPSRPADAMHESAGGPFV